MRSLRRTVGSSLGAATMRGRRPGVSARTKTLGRHGKSARYTGRDRSLSRSEERAMEAQEQIKPVTHLSSSLYGSRWSKRHSDGNNRSNFAVGVAAQYTLATLLKAFNTIKMAISRANVALSSMVMWYAITRSKFIMITWDIQSSWPAGGGSRVAPCLQRRHLTRRLSLNTKKFAELPPTFAPASCHPLPPVTLEATPSYTPKMSASKQLQHRRAHNLLLISKLLNCRESASPFTLIIDSLEQSGKSLVREFVRRANVRKKNTPTHLPRPTI